MRRFIALTVFLGCCLAQAEGPVPDAAELRRSFPDAREFTIDGGQSWIRVLIYSDGVLGGLGHNHVIASRQVEGIVWMGDALCESGLTLTVPIDSLSVDDPDARAAEGEPFAGTVPSDDRAATRRNMVGDDLLRAERHPDLRVWVQEISGEHPDITLHARVAVAGQVNRVDFPARVDRDGMRLRASGSLTVTHAQLGLEPFSAALGTLRVAEEIDLKYHIVARPAH